MATKKAPPSASRELANYDEELARWAAASAKMEEGATGGQFFSVRGGQLSWNDAPVKDNTLGAIIIDSVLENVYYEGAFDPDTPQSPTCFAFGRDDKELKPHQVVFDAGQNQSEQCHGCEHNEFGTADKGRGKACRNVRRLALLAAGSFNENGKFELFKDREQFAAASFGFLKLPVMSVKGYANYVKQLADTLKKPPFAVVTKITVKPDPRSQFRVLFEPIAELPRELIPVLMKRRTEAESVIEFPYQLDDSEAAAPAPARRSKAPPVRRAKTAPAERATPVKTAAARAPAKTAPPAPGAQRATGRRY